MEVRLVGLVVDPQHPAVLVTLESDHERLVEVNAGALAGLALHLLGDVLRDSPPSDDVLGDVDGDVEGLVQTLSAIDHLEHLLALLGDDPDNHHDVAVVPAEVRAREVHGEGHPGVVERELRLQRDLVLLVRSVLHPDLWRGEGDDLAGGGHAGVQAGGGPAPVPGAGAHHLVVLGSVLVLEVAVRTAGVGQLSPELDTPARPLPGPTARPLGRRTTAVDG